MEDNRLVKINNPIGKRTGENVRHQRPKRHNRLNRQLSTYIVIHIRKEEED